MVFLAVYFLAAAVPFLFAGLVIGGELMVAGRSREATGRHAPRSNQVYGANLIGSALGSLASLLVLAAFGGEGAVLAAIFIGSISGLIFGLAAVRRSQRTATSAVVTAVSGSAT